MFDKSQLSPEDRDFIERAAQRERQKRIEYAKAMIPAMAVFLLVGLAPAAALLALGFDTEIAGGVFLAGATAGALLFKKLEK